MTTRRREHVAIRFGSDLDRYVIETGGNQPTTVILTFKIQLSESCIA